MEKYKKPWTFIGQGTYGVVHKAVQNETKQVVAIKKIRMGNVSEEGVPIVGLREIKILKEIHHPNVVGLLDVFAHHGSIYLVFEYMETDLEAIVRDENIVLSPADIKAYMLMLLQGLEHCHTNWVLHRDLKPNNLLISPNGVLKLADFGLARFWGSPDRRFTHQVVTRWYRAPELLFGAQAYSSSVDIWACGCIFAELMLRRPYFPGDSEIDQLGKIFAALGTPTEEIWPEMTSLPDYIAFDPCPATPFKQLFTAAGDDAIDLLSRMLKFDPAQRISASEALQHPYFSNSPAPTPSERLVLPKKSVVAK